MTLRVNIDDGGSNAGRKLPFKGGHGPNCACSKCRPADVNADMELCCQDLSNRTEPVLPEGAAPDTVYLHPDGSTSSAEIRMTRCKTCNRRHFELTVDIGEVNPEGQEL